MKKYIIGFIIGLSFLGASTYALSTYITVQGGTGTTTPSGILYGDNGATNHVNTVTIGSGLTFSGGTLSSTGGGGSSTGDPFTHTAYLGQTTSATTTLLRLTGSPFSLAASSTVLFDNASSTFETIKNLWLPNITGGQLLYGGGTGIVASVATGTVSAGSSAITVTAGRSAVGGALAIDCATSGSGQNGCLSSTDWSTFNGKQASLVGTFALNSIITSNGSGTLIASSSQTTVGSLVSTTTNASYFNGALGVGTGNITGVNANAKLTVAGIGSQDIIASTTDDTTTSDAIIQTYASGNRTFLGSHGANQVSTRYGLTLGGYGEITSMNSSFGTSNGLIVGTNNAAPLIFGTNNLERLRITSAGDLGLSTTTPGGKFSIAAISGATNPVMIVSTSTTLGATTTVFTIDNNGILTVSSNSTSTFDAGIKATKLNITSTTASSTFGNGIQLSNGCFAIGTTCLSAFSNTIASGGTAATSFAANSIITSNSAGTALIATSSSPLYVDAIVATSTTVKSGIATSTPWGLFSINSQAGIQPFVIGSTTGTTLLADLWGGLGIGTTSPNQYSRFSIDAPASTKPYFTIGSSTSEVLNITPSAVAKFFVGTSTPSTSLGNFIFTTGASATTTVTWGSPGDTTSKTCYNTKTSAGTNASFYVNAAGSMIVELNLCR